MSMKKNSESGEAALIAKSKGSTVAEIDGILFCAGCHDKRNSYVSVLHPTRTPGVLNCPYCGTVEH